MTTQTTPKPVNAWRQTFRFHDDAVMNDLARESRKARKLQRETRFPARVRKTWEG